MENKSKLDGGQDYIMKTSDKHNNKLGEETVEPQSPQMENQNNLSSLSTNIVLITANVGSVFEDPIRLMPIWTSQFEEFLKRIHPGFVALHCQEVSINI